MGAALKIVETDNRDDGGTKYARTVEERFAWLKLVRKEKLSASALKLAMLLFDSCNSVTGRCNPSRSTIERECSMTNALRAINQLRDAGLIEVQTVNQRSNQYFLVLHRNNNFQPGSELSQGGLKTDPGGGSVLNHDPGSELNPKPVVNLESKPLKEPESEPVISVEALWLRHEPSQKDIEFAAKNGIDNRRVLIEWSCFQQYNIDQHMAYERQHSKWKNWVKNLLLREHELATGETPKTRAEARRRDIRSLLGKGESEPSKLSEVLKPGPSQIPDEYRKNPKEN